MISISTESIDVTKYIDDYTISIIKFEKIPTIAKICSQTQHHFSLFNMHRQPYSYIYTQTFDTSY